MLASRAKPCLVCCLIFMGLLLEGYRLAEVMFCLTHSVFSAAAKGFQYIIMVNCISSPD